MSDNRSIYERLDAINGGLRQGRDAALGQSDIAFHRELIAASGLLPLAAFNEVLEVFFKRFRESIKKAEWAKGIESHQLIIDALRDGRVEERSLLRVHIESHRDRL